MQAVIGVSGLTCICSMRVHPVAQPLSCEARALTRSSCDASRPKLLAAPSNADRALLVSGDAPQKFRRVDKFISFNEGAE